MHRYRITDLIIYPIKSLGGISVSECAVQTRGFEHDRRWMLIDEKGQFMTQRENAQLALFSCKMQESQIEVGYKNEKCHFDINQVQEDSTRVQVWSSKLKAQEVSPKISEWFSEHLGVPTTLVKMTTISKRPRRLFRSPFKTELSFADGYPYLVLGHESMNHLNAKLEVPVDINRFRANILVDTSSPHEEDKWPDFDLGTARMKIIKGCARCVVTTIDQEDGTKGKEPLKTLASYRMRRKKIYFGANAIVLKEGHVGVGDWVKV